jgi:hypothetical protein
LIAVTDKEMEALLFVMDDADLLHKLGARRGLSRERTTRVVSRLRPLLEARMLPRDLSVDAIQIVAACIEDSDWPLAYAEHRPEELDMAHAVLRGLARKVEPLGIEVARIAHA